MAKRRSKYRVRVDIQLSFYMSGVMTHIPKMTNFVISATKEEAEAFKNSQFASVHVHEPKALSCKRRKK